MKITESSVAYLKTVIYAFYIHKRRCGESVQLKDAVTQVSGGINNPYWTTNSTSWATVTLSSVWVNLFTLT